jgi:hypothetical protein
LGDCYLLAALSALAHRRPGLIRKIFHPRSSEKGLYTLQLYHNRYNKILCVDDYFPSIFVSYQKISCYCLFRGIILSRKPIMSAHKKRFGHSSLRKPMQ